MTPSPSSTENLTGTQKVALVLMQMERAQASEVLRHFSEFEADEVIAEIVRLRRVDRGIAEEVVTEVFTAISSGAPLPRGGRDFAAGLLSDTFGSAQADAVMNRLASTMAGKSFDFLEAVDPQHISVLLDDELPQTVALVLAHLKPDMASAVLAGVEPDRRTDVATCLATMGPASPDAVRTVADVLKSRIGAAVAPTEPLAAVGGIDPLVEIINRSSVTVERELLESLTVKDKDLAEEVRSRMLTFADLVRFDPRGVQRVLRGINPSILALALKGAAENVVRVVRENITERTREILDAEMRSLGPVRMSQVDEARAEVVRVIRELEQEGEITIQRVEEDTLVV
ncbi:flagellar motor switch protein FliG [Nesterenkonia halotolerans]|uniref:Flagellar motor switch protein FliG n=1 Tax=Nesterenkonia halotolerans TaxID=225325 RepID=A0ABR9J640_9MICC|nr:flagellar motor switch protein FliG [Nesterenkonia halotolerans]MBE1514463.1 flagellar motor switch protein FliG [Nesterenkonia halotolerans]